MSLASEFHRGTRAGSQVHTSLIEKAAAGLRRPHRLAGSTMQRAQTSSENSSEKKEKEKPDMSSVCFPISLLYIQSGCGMEVGVKHFYGQRMKTRMRNNKPAKAAVLSGGTRFVKMKHSSRGHV